MTLLLFLSLIQPNFPTSRSRFLVWKFDMLSIWSILRMNGYNLLEPTLRDILCMINPSAQDWSVRFQIIDELRALVEPIESLRGIWCFATCFLMVIVTQPHEVYWYTRHTLCRSDNKEAKHLSLAFYTSSRGLFAYIWCTVGLGTWSS